METPEIKHYLVTVVATTKDERGNELSFTEHFLSFGISEETAIASIMEQEYYKTDKFHCKTSVTVKPLSKLWGDMNEEHVRSVLAYYLIGDN